MPYMALYTNAAATAPNMIVNMAIHMPVKSQYTNAEANVRAGFMLAPVYGPAQYTPIVYTRPTARGPYCRAEPLASTATEMKMYTCVQMERVSMGVYVCVESVFEFCVCVCVYARAVLPS
jgi:hypothetical protein